MSEKMFSDDVDGLVHLYQDGAFNRRELVRRVARRTGSAAAALAALEGFGLFSTPAAAQCPADARVPEGAPGMETRTVEFAGPGGTVFAYLARPLDDAAPPRARGEIGGERRPAVLVIHENRGLNDHIKDVTRRVAQAGQIGRAHV